MVQSRDVFPPGHQKWTYLIYRSLRRFTKGFAFGYLGKFSFAFIGLCLRHKLNLARLLPDLLKLLVKQDLFRYGGFLGSFLMLFESSIRLLRMKGWIGRQTLNRHHRSVRVILSAVVASSCAISFLPRNVRVGISMFFTVRALEILVRWMVEEQERMYSQTLTAPDAAQDKRGSGVVALTEVEERKVDGRSTLIDADEIQVVELHDAHLSLLQRMGRSLKSAIVRISKIPASNHFDTLVMAVASSQVIWAWLFHRSSVAPSYLHFLDVQGGRVKCIRSGYVELHTTEGLTSSSLGQINAMRSSEGRGELDLTQPLTTVMCNVLHRETDSCTHALWDYWKKAYLRALPVYLPVYVLPMLLFKSGQLARDPMPILVPTITNLLRSSLFLSSYCSAAWGVACATTNVGLTSQLKGVLAGFGGGLMVAMEKKGRRVELALYVLSQSLPSTYRMLHEWGWLPTVPHGESLCFVAAMSVIMWSYVTRPHLMRWSYLSLFKFFFGSGGRSAGFSNRAVEHSTPKTNTTTLSLAAKEHVTSAEAETRLLTDADERVYVRDETNAAAAVAFAVDSLPRHVTRLSTVLDVDHEDLSDSSTSNSGRARPTPMRATSDGTNGSIDATNKRH